VTSADLPQNRVGELARNEAAKIAADLASAAGYPELISN
jgi:hypothetical protein